jgi:hypothetical protein
VAGVEWDAGAETVSVTFTEAVTDATDAMDEEAA